jgi:hypothetical protein
MVPLGSTRQHATALGRTTSIASEHFADGGQQQVTT